MKKVNRGQRQVINKRLWGYVKRGRLVRFLGEDGVEYFGLPDA